jgi:hypothetical protein
VLLPLSGVRLDWLAAVSSAGSAQPLSVTQQRTSVFDPVDGRNANILVPAVVQAAHRHQQHHHHPACVRDVRVG